MPYNKYVAGRKCITGPKRASGKNSAQCWRCAFVLSPQAVDLPKKNACAYDGSVTGQTIYAYAEGNPVSYTDPTGEFVPQLIGFAIGAGLEYLTNPCASATDILLAGGLGAIGGGLSKAAFLRLGARSLTRETGLEWSHSIAKRTVNRYTSGGLNKVLNQRGGLNGSWRTPASHARHDASRYVPGVDPMPLPLRALDRIPDWLKGTGVGKGAGAAIAGGDCECSR